MDDLPVQAGRLKPWMYVAALAVLLALLAIMFRYTTTQGPGSNVTRLDRWTGQTCISGTEGC
jgi:hypothetical protein